MKELIGKLLLEEEELDIKIQNLYKALQSKGFKEKVGEYQFALLEIQYANMLGYSRVLELRIKDLNK